MAGSWTAQYQGRTYLRLEITVADGKLAGAISLGDVEVDKDGVPKRVSEAKTELTPIFDVVGTGATLKFARKDGSDTDRIVS